MRTRFHLLLLCFALMPASSFSDARAQQKLSGSYTMYINNQAAGEESFTVTANADGSLQSEANTQAAGGIKAHLLTTAAAKNSSLKFSLDLGGVPALKTTIDSGTAKVTIADEPERLVKTDASLILENAVWNHFIFLLRQYDVARGGSQSFKAFIPSLIKEMALQVERVDAPKFTVKQQSIATEHYRLSSGPSLKIDFWTDAERVPLLIQIPLQAVKVIRRGAEELADVVFGKPVAENDLGAKFTSEEVAFNNGDVKLAGTLTLPKDMRAPYAAAVIITGSGPQDRDGAMGVFNLYKLVAESLSNAGVAVLRADDRGVGKSLLADPKRPTSYRDLINDSKAAFEYLTNRSDIDKTRIALVGHSEGAETALTMAAEDSRVAAIVLLAGSARPIDRVAWEQSIYQLALQETTDPSDSTKFPEVARTILQRFDATRNQKPPKNGPDGDAWFREHINSDPSALARRVKCPVLILNGERDALVLAHNAIELAQALTPGGNKQVRLRIFPNLTHMFTPASLDKSAPAEQATVVSSEMLQTVSDWMVRVLNKRL